MKLEDICQHIVSIHPNTEEIMNTIKESTLCTNTQCFASPEDAGFGFMPSTTNSTSLLPIIIMTFVYMSVIFARRNHASSKPNALRISDDRHEI